MVELEDISLERDAGKSVATQKVKRKFSRGSARCRIMMGGDLQCVTICLTRSATSTKSILNVIKLSSVWQDEMRKCCWDLT
jgi:hypothetical protein